MAQTRVLVVGAGKLGTAVVQQLLNRGVAVTVLARSPEKIDEGLRSKVTIVKGDLADESAVDVATKGVELVVSCVQGGPDAIIDGQVRLYDAAEKNGVKRFIPSDFSVNLMKMAYGSHPWLDMRRAFSDRVRGRKVALVNVLQGGFYEVIFSSFFGIYDHASRSLKYYGSADQVIDLTTVHDTAVAVAEIALDVSITGVVETSGVSASLKELAAAYEQATGEKLNLVNQGSIADLEALIAKIKSEHPDPREAFHYAFFQYQWAFASGAGTLTSPRKFPGFVHTDPVAMFKAFPLPPVYK
eukprot:TRINITY_DN15266_c0_g1_i1.p1 TRINITY_DN15266_c0_g1~~TRINITY_DN15266_c0_g1_i1.p1  ORF type:complete len:299 (-),score=56.68 TRINITY_DN15266_c0_g1_i1:40-936(-)